VTANTKILYGSATQSIELKPVGRAWWCHDGGFSNY